MVEVVLGCVCVCVFTGVLNSHDEKLGLSSNNHLTLWYLNKCTGRDKGSL